MCLASTGTQGAPVEPASPLDMREEMSSGFFGHPTRAPHGVDQLEDAGHKPGRISDAFAALVPIPTQADHSENDRRARRSPGRAFSHQTRLLPELLPI
jgi:hypothetical protein